MSIVSTISAQHFHWGQSCDGWHLLALDDLSVIDRINVPFEGAS